MCSFTLYFASFSFDFGPSVSFMSLPYNPYEFSHTVVCCPFNKNHRIARDRLPKHISKCEKNYPVDHKVMCPYDATHRLAKSEVAEHIVACPMRTLVEPEVHEFLTQKSSGYEVAMLDISERLYDSIDEICTEDTEDTENIERNDSSCKIPKIKNDKIELRPPRGYSEAMMFDPDDNSVADDTESVASFMAVGRGSCIEKNRAQSIQTIGRGRGMLLQTIGRDREMFSRQGD